MMTLLAGARHRQGSAPFHDYRPTDTDHIRAIAACTANLVLLAILLDEGIEVPSWQSTLDLWRSGLATNSWYALLAAIEWDEDVLLLRLSGERTRSTGLDATLRHAELVRDYELERTLRIGRTISESAMDSGLLPEPSDPESKELLSWLVTILAFGKAPDDRPMHDERLAELLEAHYIDNFLPLIEMVLKQRAAWLPRQSSVTSSRCCSTKAPATRTPTSPR